MRAEYIERRDLLISALEGIEEIRPFTPKGFFVWAELDPEIYARLGWRGRCGWPVGDARGAWRGSAPSDAFGDTCADAIRFSFSCATPMVRGAAALRQALTANTPASV